MVQIYTTSHGGATHTAPLYDMLGQLSGKGTIDAMLKELLDAMNKPSKTGEPLG